MEPARRLGGAVPIRHLCPLLLRLTECFLALQTGPVRHSPSPTCARRPPRRGAEPRHDRARQRAEIRRLFYAEQWPIGTIADALGVHHATVRRTLNRARGIHPGPQIRPSQLDPYKAFIAATLEQPVGRNNSIRDHQAAW
jgi:hypothetical protein